MVRVHNLGRHLRRIRCRKDAFRNLSFGEIFAQRKRSLWVDFQRGSMNLSNSRPWLVINRVDAIGGISVIFRIPRVVMWRIDSLIYSANYAPTWAEWGKGDVTNGIIRRREYEGRSELTRPNWPVRGPGTNFPTRCANFVLHNMWGFRFWFIWKHPVVVLSTLWCLTKSDATRTNFLDFLPFK